MTGPGHEVAKEREGITAKMDVLVKEWKEKMSGSVEVRNARENLKMLRMKIRELTEELSIAEEIEEELEAQRDAESKMREETSYTLTLEHMLERLKSERVNFDTTLHAYEVRSPLSTSVFSLDRAYLTTRATASRCARRPPTPPSRGSRP